MLFLYWQKTTRVTSVLIILSIYSYSYICINTKFYNYHKSQYWCALSLSSARDGSLYATRRDQIYKFNRNGVGIQSGFPKKTRKVYKRAPKSAGAAVQDRYGRVYMFKGWQSFLLETVMFYREIVLLSFHFVFSMSAIQILCIININNISIWLSYR